MKNQHVKPHQNCKVCQEILDTCNYGHKEGWADFSDCLDSSCNVSREGWIRMKAYYDRCQLADTDDSDYWADREDQDFRDSVDSYYGNLGNNS